MIYGVKTVLYLVMIRNQRFCLNAVPRTKGSHILDPLSNQTRLDHRQCRQVHLVQNVQTHPLQGLQVVLKLHVHEKHNNLMSTREKKG